MNTIVNNKKDINKENPSAETPWPVRQISPLKSRKETMDRIVNVGKYKSWNIQGLFWLSKSNTIAKRFKYYVNKKEQIFDFRTIIAKGGCS